MRDYIVHERHFLNHPGHHTNAFIQAYIMNEESEYEENYWPSGLVISDCDRKINLCIDLNNMEDIENTLHKIDTLLFSLKELRKGVVQVRRIVRQRGR